MQRTLLYKDDLDWLPQSFKVLRWTVTGSIWAGMAGLVGVFAGATGALAGAGKGLVVAGIAAGDAAARGVLRMRLRKLARGQVQLSRLAQRADGELVHVRGRVRAREQIDGLVTPARGVFRRVVMHFGELRVVHEAAVDFVLVDENGESIIVQVEGARIVAPTGKLEQWPGTAPEVARALALPLPKETRRWQEKRTKKLAKGKKPAKMRASEYLLRDGDEVEVVGYKNRTVDVTVEERLARDTPLRATLRSGRELPLILSPARR